MRALEATPVRLNQELPEKRHTPASPDVPLTTLPLPPSVVVVMTIDGGNWFGPGVDVSCCTLVSCSAPRKVTVKLVPPFLLLLAATVTVPPMPLMLPRATRAFWMSSAVCAR